MHCSAGIGRSGTFVAICLMIEAVKELQKLEEARQMDGTDEMQDQGNDQQLAAGLLIPRVSVFGTVRRLREQRCYMVKK